MAFLTRNKDEILRNALNKIAANTNLTSTGPGTIVRALTEAIASELSDLYNIVDFNLSLQTLSTSVGRNLELLGSLYGVTRKTLTDIATIDKTVGAFYFYIDAPLNQGVVIPAGTQVLTNSEDFVGTVFTFATTEDTVIPIGRTRAWASIKPLFADSIYSAGAKTLVSHSFTPTDPTLIIRCTNPKPISPQVGYEDDDSFRARIVAAVRTSAGGTLQAMRFAGLNVAGVRDVTVRNAAFGLGTIDVLIVFDSATALGQNIVAVRDALDQVRPAGVRMFVRTPDLIPLDITANILLRNVANVDREGEKRRAQIAVLRYLNTMLVGTNLVYAQLLTAILEASENIVDVTLSNFSANGQQLLRRNYLPDPDKQIVPGTITAAVSNP